MATETEKLRALILICSLFIAFLFLSLPVMSQEVEDEGEFNYDENSEQGPSHWGGLCENGTMQSPIDLLNNRVETTCSLGRLQTNYHPSYATIENSGHDIKINWTEGGGYLQINTTKYELENCHWHSPSEHTIDGTRFDLELHMVHKTPWGQIAVIGILYKIGLLPDSFLASLMDNLKDFSTTGEKSREVGIVDPRQIQIVYKHYYRYNGSLTTPPCTENVTWTISKEIRSVSEEQVKLLRVAVRDESYTNARPLQPTNNRTVQLYKCTPK